MNTGFNQLYWICAIDFGGINEVGQLLFSVIAFTVLHFAVCTDLESTDSVRMEESYSTRLLLSEEESVLG